MIACASHYSDRAEVLSACQEFQRSGPDEKLFVVSRPTTYAPHFPSCGGSLPSLLPFCGINQWCGEFARIWRHDAFLAPDLYSRRHRNPPSECDFPHQSLSVDSSCITIKHLRLFIGLSIRCDVVGAVVSFATAMFVVFSKRMDASLAGFVLSYSLNFSTRTYWVILIPLGGIS